MARGPVGGERTASCDPWEVREQLFRGFRASQTYITGSESNVNGSKAEGRACLDAASQTCCTGSESNVRHSGGVRGGPLSGDFWSRIRLWKAVAEEITRNRCLPARGPVGGERTASCVPARGPVARGPVGGERTASCVPARGPVGGERTAFSMLPRRFRDSRRLEAWLKGRKRKMLESGRKGVLDAAAQTYFTGSESNVRHSGGVRGGPLLGDLWSRIRLWKAVAKESTRNRCLPARGPVGGERTASCAPV